MQDVIFVLDRHLFQLFKYLRMYGSQRTVFDEWSRLRAQPDRSFSTGQAVMQIAMKLQVRDTY